MLTCNNRVLISTQMKNISKNTIMSIFKNIALASLVLITSHTSQAAELKKVEKEITTPALKLESLKGDILDLKDEAGKVVLVQFWATYCTPCRVEMPSMNNLIKKLESKKVPFKIIAINMGETKEEVQKFVDEVKPEFTILMDSTGENTQAWNVFAAPSNFVIDTKGKIRYTLYGGVEWDSEEITKVIQDLAAES